MPKKVFPLGSLLAILSLVLAACGGAPATSAPPTDAPASEAAPTTAPQTQPTTAPADDRVEITWFVGLGTGQQPEQVAAQEEVVRQFNESQDRIRLVIEIINYEVSVDTLSTRLASGDAPDIVGPVGVAGSNAFSGQWLDLQPLVDSTNYDLSDFDPAAVDFYRVEGEGLIGLPFGVFPSFLYFDKDLFDEAGLPYPPQAYDEPYADGDPWTIEKMAELAQLLTVDANGNDATSPDFDPDSIVQWGFHSQWTDPRGEATLFGAGSFVNEDGEAVVPEHWREAFQWYYDGIWEHHFIPSDAYVNSDLLGNGNVLGSGNVAMVNLHLWCHACREGDNWDIAALPAYQGEVTAKLHADTFRIMKATKHPAEAFEVLSYLLGEGAPALLEVYGAMPARKSLQDAFFATLDEAHPQGVNWDVAIASLAFADNPSHESNMPNFNRANERIGAFQTLYRSTPGLDIQAELDTLQSDLQAIFDEAD